MKNALVRAYGKLLLLSIIVGVCFVISLGIGSVAIPPQAVVAVLLGKSVSQPAWQEIILQFRLPRSLTAMAAGSALATSGLLLQSLFRNPLAGPSVLGINAGASLGAALVVLTGGSAAASSLAWLSQIRIIGAASGGAAIATLLVVAIAQHLRSTLALLIFGLMFGYTTTALVTILLHFSSIAQTRTYVAWTFGSFAGVAWPQLPALLAVVGMGVGLSQFLSKPLNILSLGEEQAVSLGIHVRRLRLGLILLASLLAGTITAFCGPIAFLGVAVPHLCRIAFATVDHQILTFAVVLMGALLALISDAIAQLPGSAVVLPLNAVTALLGGPIITGLVLLQSRRLF